MNAICAICEEVHDIELLKIVGDGGILLKVWKCSKTEEEWESIKTPQTIEEWSEMYIHCKNKECGNVWCDDCTRVWKAVIEKGKL